MIDRRVKSRDGKKVTIAGGMEAGGGREEASQGAREQGREGQRNGGGWGVELEWGV